MKSITIIIFIYFFCTNIIQAQSPTENLSKYWNYRARLLGTNGHAGFIDVGLGQGKSLPALESFPQTPCDQDWYIVNRDCKPHKGRGRLHWGDATVHLGSYIAVLALEYANLERTNQTTAAVAEELWFALEAFERLDSLAEVSLGLAGKKDGFFLRDDVAIDFYKEKEKKENRRFKGEKETYDCVSSSYLCGATSVNQGDFISQDQVLSLFIGFMTVKQLIPNKRYKKNLPTFGEKVAINAHRIVSYMIASKWALKDPMGNKIPDKWGGNAIGLSYPIASIANKLTSNKYKKNYLKKGAGSSGRFVYSMLHITLSMQSFFNKDMALTSMTLLNKTKNKTIAQKAIKHDVIIFPLLHAVLFDHQLSNKIKKQDLVDLIDTAPFDGPCFKSPNCNAPDGWKSADRWHYPLFKNGNPYGVHAQTVGLDYMLLYNLYHYYYQKDLPKYQK